MKRLEKLLAESPADQLVRWEGSCLPGSGSTASTAMLRCAVTNDVNPIFYYYDL